MQQRCSAPTKSSHAVGGSAQFFVRNTPNELAGPVYFEERDHSRRYGHVFHGGVFGVGTDPGVAYVRRLLEVLLLSRCDLRLHRRRRRGREELMV